MKNDRDMIVAAQIIAEGLRAIARALHGARAVEATGSIDTFLAECCALSSSSEESAKTLREAYAIWCKAHGVAPLPARTFGVWLGRRGLKRRKSKGVHVYSGVSVKPHKKQKRGGRNGFAHSASSSRGAPD